MKYLIKEIFPTIQGEGSLTGSPAVFIRFSGCNLWNGKEQFRYKGKGECAMWCDTDFADGSKMDEEEIFLQIENYTKDWKDERPLLVITGGEPIMHLTDKKCSILYSAFPKYKLSVETNGTISNQATSLFDTFGHITLSPKPLKSDLKTIDHIKLRKCTDLKIIVPTPMPIDLLVNNIDYKYLYFQPMDVGDNGRKNSRLALELAMKYDGRVSIQSHKMAGFR